MKVPVAEFPIKITYQGSEWQNWLDYFILYRDVSKKGLFSAEFCFLTTVFLTHFETVQNNLDWLFWTRHELC